MIIPDDVNLIIFDMDGTIIPSLPAVYESIKRAFARLGWQVTFSPEDINQFFGVSTASTAGGLYEFITPPDSHLTVQEIRERVRAEYDAVFREMAQPYPGVKETLQTLRQRGYKLAQYTNASTMYLNLVMSSLGLRDYFDYIECIQDNNLTKPELVKKIRGYFGGLTAAIVGDRSHDVEAARASDCLSIGVLFGYGENEPEEADLTINKFDDLLSIFDRRLPIFKKITDKIERTKSAEKPFVIGISGIDCSGKTVFTEALEKYLSSRDYPTQVIHLDDFTNPKKVRYSGDDQVENYFNRSFDIQTIIRKLLVPVREKGEYSVSLKAFDVASNKFGANKGYSFSHRTIVIFEGVFLFRKELAAYIDYKIFLDIPEEICLERSRSRDSEEVRQKYEVKYFPAQRKYLRQYPPQKAADMIIDNSHWEYPVIKPQY